MMINNIPAAVLPDDVAINIPSEYKTSAYGSEDATNSIVVSMVEASSNGSDENKNTGGHNLAASETDNNNNIIGRARETGTWIRDGFAWMGRIFCRAMIGDMASDAWTFIKQCFTGMVCPELENEDNGNEEEDEKEDEDETDEE